MVRRLNALVSRSEELVSANPYLEARSSGSDSAVDGIEERIHVQGGGRDDGRVVSG